MTDDGLGLLISAPLFGAALYYLYRDIKLAKRVRVLDEKQPTESGGPLAFTVGALVYLVGRLLVFAVVAFVLATVVMLLWKIIVFAWS